MRCDVRRRLLLLLALAPVRVGGVWEYNPEWVAAHPSDLDVIARAVAPDIFGALGASSVAGPQLNGSFANPCWHEQATRKLRCLPAFYLVGGFQCGVHDLGRRLQLVPDAVTPRNPFDPFWSSGPGFGGDWARFTRQMDKASAAIARNPSRALAFVSNPAMLAFTWAEHARVHDVFASSVQSCWKQCRRERQPASVAELCADKRYKLDHCLRRAYETDPAAAIGPPGVEFTLPQLMVRAHGRGHVKLVALLRNPSDRLWSAFHSYAQFADKYGVGELGVGAYFEEQSAEFNRCVARYDSRTCAMHLEGLGERWQSIFYHCDQLIKTLYAVFVREWITAFGPEQLLCLRTEDYVSPDTHKPTLARVLTFVGLRADKHTLQLMAAAKVKSGAGSRGTRHHHPKSWTMSASLRAKISAFFQPFNADLAELTGDAGFRDWPVHMPPSTPEGALH